jgi:hypothetical protein
VTIRKRKNVAPDAGMKIIMQKIVLILFLMVSTSVFAMGREVAYENIFTQYPGSIVKISNCGNWENKGSDGQYRLIELSMYGQSFLYVDRVVTNQQDGVKKVVGHTGFAEFNSDHAELSLRKINCKVVKNTLQIQALAESGHDQTTKKVKIEVKLDDSYVIQGI